MLASTLEGEDVNLDDIGLQESLCQYGICLALRADPDLLRLQRSFVIQAAGRQQFPVGRVFEVVAEGVWSAAFGRKFG